MQIDEKYKSKFISVFLINFFILRVVLYIHYSFFLNHYCGTCECTWCHISVYVYMSDSLAGPFFLGPSTATSLCLLSELDRHKEQSSIAGLDPSSVAG